MVYGWREGRDPSQSFSTLFYKDKYLGIDNKNINPLQHFSNLSSLQNKKTVVYSNDEFISIQKNVIRPFFDAKFYVNMYKLNFVPDPLTHYVTTGWRQGFEPNKYFKSHDHLIRHSHLVNRDLCPFYHFISTYKLLDENKTLVKIDHSYEEFQNKETNFDHILKSISNDFDSVYYLNSYADVREAGIDPLFHYVHYGYKEGRNPSEIFWTTYYKETYHAEFEPGTNPLYHYVTEGRAQGFKPNPIGTRLWPTVIAPSADEWTKAVPAADIASADVVVIIPVYKGYDETLRAIHSVLAHPQTSRFALLVINDCGPEAELNEAISRLADRNYFLYIRNETNLGFVASVNKALDHSASKDVILLNSDAVPYGDWIDRMLWHAQAHTDAATITPLSNNATICSYPQFNHNNRFQLEISIEQLDAYARSCSRHMSSKIPTGVGFCFFIRRSVLDAIGVFDVKTFGRGYGEENDFCMRAQKAGYRNLMAHDIFVYHAGGVSFDSTYVTDFSDIEKRLLRKHPDYKSHVYQYITADPSKEARIRLDLYRIAKHLGSRTAVFISHGLGGGIDTHIRDASARLAGEEVELITLKVSGSRTLKLEFSPFTTRALPTFAFVEFHIDKHAHLISAFLEWLNPLIVHVQSFVGLDWESTQCLMRIIKEAKRYYYTLHDYSPVCHRNNLVTPLARYCGLPEPETCRQCIAIDHQSRGVVDPAMRREAFSRFLADATAVFAPSADIAERLRPHLPDAKIVIRPHEEVLPAVHRPASPASARRGVGKDPSTVLLIAAVGAIGPHKGSRVIHDLALDARIRDLPIEYRIIGYSDITDRLAAVGVPETGPYETDGEAMDLLRILGVDLVLIPSVWPETYCYALSLALAAGIPPAVFDLGAQAERLRASNEGLRLNPDLIDDPAELNNILLSSPILEIYKNRKEYKRFLYKHLLMEYYDTTQQN
ncbi:hypothetical protein MPEAHAMD_6493 [Methylobacterium frigidaeris]|uniref:Glycosyltransferase 2-like domain-containing protein n=2 Tax=Methylobacterium frigidaeris TaxID=2038277 RepID=A0AA37M8N6_9HYPH|nr:hypothetical protein MPEAHAMD_6493 [Methylobacterium frigidaeris]